ncbi:MAG: helix-turn-helix transcriptional regulator [Eubacteriales bacterium]
MIISDKILYLRKKVGYTQEELAEQLNVSRQSISKWEGAQSIPDIEKIMNMAKLFSVSTDYLLRDEIEICDSDSNAMDLVDKSAVVTIEIANLFLSIHTKYSLKIASGVFLCIFASVPLISLNALFEHSPYENIAYAVGIGFIFVCIVSAILLFIYSENLITEYRYISKGEFELSYNVEGIIKEQQKSYQTLRTRNRMINVGLLILSPSPLIICGLLFDVDAIYGLMVVFLLTVVAVAIFRMIYSEGIGECYEMLLLEGDYNIHRSKNRKKKDIVVGIYWSISVVIYLLWSFLTYDWHITWIVWPIAGLLSSVLNLLWLKEE